MQLTLPPNQLFNQQQTLDLHNGVATLIGGNGSGKSCILRSIFDMKLNGTDLSNKNVVCFSSGQNEAFTKLFELFLARERRTNDALSLEGFFFDKSWSKILIFLATTIYPQGRVRQFLRENNYIDESIGASYSEDGSTALTIEFKVNNFYIDQVRRAKLQEAGGDPNTLLQSTYFKSLENFVDKNVRSEYEFEEPIPTQQILLTPRNIRLTEFAEAGPAEQSSRGARSNRHPIVGFFVQAADQDFFLKRTAAHLTFKGGLELDHLSDGEFQILFLYSLFDLFDSTETLFLLDEADSHLHFGNIKKLWEHLQNLAGQVVTTTHLLDSIVANDFESLFVIEKGVVQEGQKLKQLVNRLSVLSKISNIELEVCARIRFLAILDDYNDWEIFVRLCARKGLNIFPLKQVQAVKKTSSYGTVNEKFGQPKIDWTRNLSLLGKEVKTEKIFLICDRDNAAIDFGNSSVVVTGGQYRDQLNNLRWPNGRRDVVHLLAWSRREIKNYLLSFTALSIAGRLREVNNHDLPQNSHLKLGDTGDCEAIRNINAKPVIDQLINGADGLCYTRLQDYIDSIPVDEISDDIFNMHAYIVGKLI